MAQFTTALYTSQIGTPGASLNVGIGLSKNVWGKLRLVPVPYTVAGTEASADTIRLYNAKPGSRLIAGLSRVVKGATGTTITTNIGDASNATRYASALALGGAAGTIEFNSGPGTDAYVPTDITAVAGAADQLTILATLSTVASPTASAKILFLLAILDE